MNDIPDSTQTPTTDAAEAPPVAPVADASPVSEAAPAETPAAAAPASEAPAAPAADMSPAACAAQLKALFPALFSGPFKPLKLRVQADIQARAPGQFTKAQLSAFLRRYTGNTGYLIALGKATQRFDLDGQPAGELSEEHRAAAREELARRRGLQQERLAAEQAERDLAQTQRRNRAGLLYDFERTTLTLPNFCVLKGVSPEELPALLDQARAERAEAPVREPREAPGRRDGREARDPRSAPRGPRGDGRTEGRPGARRDGPRRPGGPSGAGRGKPSGGR
ncbi:MULTISPECIES: ProQ/FinO family protein [Roseateles]|uniref:ProQ/FinO family protein n=1 Tax=Roseateles TaxID=93681 RepID=UPI00149511D3|nr:MULTISPECIES: ProQ/FinO family protein [Roseateles]WIV98438.1 ProQ/FINO family protein [Paucibacter aquatile]